MRTAAFFEPDNESLGVLSVRNLLLNDRGHIKLISIHTSPLEAKHFLGMVHKTDLEPLSPEELMAIQEKNYSPVLDHSLTDSFAIGMLVLECSLLLNSRDIINA